MKQHIYSSQIQLIITSTIENNSKLKGESSDKVCMDIIYKNRPRLRQVSSTLTKTVNSIFKLYWVFEPQFSFFYRITACVGTMHLKISSSLTGHLGSVKSYSDQPESFFYCHLFVFLVSYWMLRLFSDFQWW
jgi:hypothetical protein